MYISFIFIIEKNTKCLHYITFLNQFMIFIFAYCYVYFDNIIRHKTE